MSTFHFVDKMKKNKSKGNIEKEREDNWNNRFILGKLEDNNKKNNLYTNKNNTNYGKFVVKKLKNINLSSKKDIIKPQIRITPLNKGKSRRGQSSTRQSNFTNYNNYYITNKGNINNYYQNINNYTNNNEIINSESYKEEEDDKDTESIWKMNYEEIKVHLNLLYSSLLISHKYKKSINEIIQHIPSSTSRLAYMHIEASEMKKLEISLFRLANIIKKREKLVKILDKISSIIGDSYLNNDNNNIMSDNMNGNDYYMKNDIDDKINNIENNIHNKHKRIVINSISAKDELWEDFVYAIINIRETSINIIEDFNAINNKIIRWKNEGKIGDVFEKYGIDKMYLLKMRYDLDFLGKKNINKYKQYKLNFSNEGDPFLISVSNIIPIASSLMKKIMKCQYIIMQEVIFDDMNNDGKDINNNNINNDNNKTDSNNNNNNDNNNNINNNNINNDNKNNNININFNPITTTSNNNNTSAMNFYTNPNESGEVKTYKNKNEAIDSFLRNNSNENNNNEKENAMNGIEEEIKNIKKIKKKHDERKKNESKNKTNKDLSVNEDSEKDMVKIDNKDNNEDNNININKKNDVGITIPEQENDDDINKKSIAFKDSNTHPEQPKNPNINIKLNIPDNSNKLKESINSRYSNNKSLLNMTPKKDKKSDIIFKFFNGKYSYFESIYKDYYCDIPEEQRIAFNITEDLNSKILNYFSPKILLCLKDIKNTTSRKSVDNIVKNDIIGICIFSFDFSGNLLQILINHLSVISQNDESIIEKFINYIKENINCNEIFVDIYYKYDKNLGKFIVSKEIKDTFKTLNFKWVKLVNTANYIRFQKMKLQVSTDDIDIKQSNFNLRSILLGERENNNQNDNDGENDFENKGKFDIKISFILRNKTEINFKVNGNALDDNKKSNKNIKYLNVFPVVYLLNKLEIQKQINADFSKCLDNKDEYIKSLTNLYFSNVSEQSKFYDKSLINNELHTSLNNNASFSQNNNISPNISMRMNPIFPSNLPVIFNGIFYNRMSLDDGTFLLDSETNQNFFSIKPNNDGFLFVISGNLTEEFKNKYIINENGMESKADNIKNNLSLRFKDMYANLSEIEKGIPGSNKGLFIPSFDVNLDVISLETEILKGIDIKKIDDDNNNFNINYVSENVNAKLLNEFQLKKNNIFESIFEYDQINEEKDIVINDDFIIIILNLDVLTILNLPMCIIHVKKENFIKKSQ